MSNATKSKLLGMPHGTAANRLRKSILFSLVCRLDLNECFQCQEEILSVDDLSIEHKEPWIQSEHPIDSFFDLDNIAFSHLRCNVGAAGPRPRKVFRTDKELKEMKKRSPSRAPEARKKEYAKAKVTRPDWIRDNGG